MTRNIFRIFCYKRKWTTIIAAMSFEPGQTNGDSSSSKKAKLPSELEEFDEVFPTLVCDLTEPGIKNKEVGDAVTWFKRVLEYNVPYGKKTRGLTVVQSYRYLLGDKVTTDDLHIARVVGWCVELLQAYFLIADDIMDKSETRRGQPCWYKRPEVGMIAINDALYIESAIFFLLKKYCRSKPYYVDLMELFHDISLKTITGQNLDTCTPSPEGVDFTNYTTERYNAIVRWKTAYYSFYLPVALAMYMAGINDEKNHSNAKAILLKMGEFFQIQDDYLDCYGDPAITGKVGTDIQDNKCSWLVIQALNKASEQQKQILQDNYAQWETEKVESVKEVFNQLNLQQVYAEYEESSYKELLTLIENFCGDLPNDMFLAFAKKIYKRQK